MAQELGVDIAFQEDMARAASQMLADESAWKVIWP